LNDKDLTLFQRY